jgi:hypothetical protein
MNISPNSKTDVITCPGCGHQNPIWNTTCEKCYKKLSNSAVSDITNRRIIRSRPGCITAYAILIFIGAGFTALSGLILATLFFVGTKGTDINTQLFGGRDIGAVGTIGLFVMLGIIAFITLLYIVLGWGLWNLKNWARWIVIVLTGMGICGNLLSFIQPFIRSSANSQGTPIIATISGGLFSIVLSGIIIYWFSTNGDYFN